MTDYKQGGTPWNAYLSKIKTVVIGNDVTSIGTYAFYGCDSLTGMTSASGETIAVTTGAPQAKDGSAQSKLTKIGAYAFGGCSSLTAISIPDSVTSIAEGTFKDCSSLTSVALPDTVTTIGTAAFDSCSSLTAISIPESVTTIAEGTFKDCSSLTSVAIPEGVKTIGNAAFEGCDSLTTISIPDSVTSIGENVFSEDSIPDIYCGEGSYAETWADKKEYTTIVVPPIVTQDILVLPADMTRLADDAFTGCAAQRVVIPAGTKSIGSGVFAGSTKLTQIRILASDVTIAEDAFSGLDADALYFWAPIGSDTVSRLRALGYTVIEE